MKIKLKTKGIVYVAGQYRDKNEYRIRQNILVAETHTLKLLKLGYTPICPHKNFAYLGSEIGNKKIMDSCLELLRVSDYIYLLPNWRESVGAKREYHFAQKHGISILKV